MVKFNLIICTILLLISIELNGQLSYTPFDFKGDSMSVRYQEIQVSIETYYLQLLDTHAKKLSEFTGKGFIDTRKKILKEWKDSLSTWDDLKEIVAVQKFINKEYDGFIYPADMAEVFFRNDFFNSRYQFLESANLSINPTTSNSLLNTNFYSDIIKSFKVEVAFALGDQNQVSSDSSLIEKIFVGSGSNFTTNIYHPIYHKTNRDISLAARVMGFGNVGLNLPVLNNNIDSTAINVMAGINLDLFAAGINNHLRLYLNSDLGFLTGGSYFRNNVVNGKGGVFLNINLGLSFMDVFYLSYRKNFNKTKVLNPEYVSIAFKNSLD